MLSLKEVPKTLRRDKLVIMAAILTVAKEGAYKTSMYRANLSFNQLKKYLTLLCQLKLLKECVVNGKIVYCTTEKGVEFCKKQQQILCMLVV
jgi:predicted transcriptional regulator